MNERISIPLNRKSVTTDRNKGFFWNIIPQDEKTASSRKDIWRIGTKWFAPPNKGFVEKINLH